MPEREDRLSVLEKLMGFALDPDEVSGPDLPPDLRAARGVWFLLHRDERGDTRSFLVETLERLMRDLQCQTDRVSRNYRGRIRGRIVWTETLKSRYTDELDPTRFVCREARRHFDTPENQLLRYVMAAIGDMVRAVPPVMREGRCYYPSTKEIAVATIGEELRPLENILTRFQRNRRLQEISLPQKIGPTHLLRAESSRAESYSRLVSLYGVYRETVMRRGWQGLGRAARSVMPLPARADSEGLPWIRLAATAWRAGCAEPLRSRG